MSLKDDAIEQVIERVDRDLNAKFWDHLRDAVKSPSLRDAFFALLDSEVEQAQVELEQQRRFAPPCYKDSRGLDDPGAA